MAEFKLIFDYLPSPRTVQRFIDAVQISRDKLINSSDSGDQYINAQVDVLNDLIRDLSEYKQEIDYDTSETRTNFTVDW